MTAIFHLIADDWRPGVPWSARLNGYETTDAVAVAGGAPSDTDFPADRARVAYRKEVNFGFNGSGVPPPGGIDFDNVPGKTIAPVIPPGGGGIFDRSYEFIINPGDSNIQLFSLDETLYIEFLSPAGGGNDRVSVMLNADSLLTHVFQDVEIYDGEYHLVTVLIRYSPGGLNYALYVDGAFFGDAIIDLSIGPNPIPGYNPNKTTRLRIDDDNGPGYFMEMMVHDARLTADQIAKRAWLFNLLRG